MSNLYPIAPYENHNVGLHCVYVCVGGGGGVSRGWMCECVIDSGRKCAREPRRSRSEIPQATTL
jgi:hypothetical protein